MIRLSREDCWRMSANLPLSDLSFGLLLSITCSDDVPFVSEEQVDVATQNTFLRTPFTSAVQDRIAHLGRAVVRPSEFRMSANRTLEFLFSGLPPTAPSTK